MLTNAPEYVPHTVTERDLQVTSIKKLKILERWALKAKIKQFSKKCGSNVQVDPNVLVIDFFDMIDVVRRLKRFFFKPNNKV